MFTHPRPVTVNSPPDETVATAVAFDDHSTSFVTFLVDPSRYRAVAVNWLVSPAVETLKLPVIPTELRVAGGGACCATAVGEVGDWPHPPYIRDASPMPRIVARPTPHRPDTCDTTRGICSAPLISRMIVKTSKQESLQETYRIL
jgi:hypothetical protein